MSTRCSAFLTVVGAKCKVSFDTPNSLASVLGFKQDIVYGVLDVSRVKNWLIL